MGEQRRRRASHGWRCHEPTAPAAQEQVAGRSGAGTGGRGQRRGELAEPQVQEERTSMASHGTSQQQQGRRARPPAAAGEEAPAQHPQPADVGGDGSGADGAGGDGSVQGEAAGGDSTVYRTLKQFEEQYKCKWSPQKQQNAWDQDLTAQSSLSCGTRPASSWLSSTSA